MIAQWGFPAKYRGGIVTAIQKISYYSAYGIDKNPEYV
jgi:hypothetical protein